MPPRGWRRPILAVLVPLAAIVAADAYLVEPYRLEVTHHRIDAPFDPPLKIAHLTDLHTRGLGRNERRMFAILAAERPDLIVVTGDIMNSLGTPEEAASVLRELHAPLGVWAVRGNWDVFPTRASEEKFFADGGVQFLLNRGVEVRPGLYLMGFDDEPFGSPRTFPVLRRIPRDAFKLAIHHFPIYFDDVAGFVDLSLAGHTHGGQIRIPFLPVFWLPDGCEGYLEGWYEKRGSRMYVSRGLGMSLIPIRLLCRPEIAFIAAGRAGPPR
jgi:hypothetical protein